VRHFQPATDQLFSAFAVTGGVTPGEPRQSRNVRNDRELPAAFDGERVMAQKGGGGNPGAVTKKGGDGASGSTGTGRGGGKSGNSGKKG
jgi:hypothetical protein